MIARCNILCSLHPYIQASITRGGYFVSDRTIGGDRDLNNAEQEVQVCTTLADARLAVQRAQGWDPLTMELHALQGRARFG